MSAGADRRPTLDAEGGVLLRPTDSDGDSRFRVERDSETVGHVALRETGERRAELSWSIRPEPDGQALATAAVRRLLTYAFKDAGMQRIETRALPDDEATLRIAARAGLRREGRMRSHGGANGARSDYLLLARLADDPDVREQEGFIGILNSNLPRKRVISQGLLRDWRGRILLCELTYKREWDLPGGVVEPDESPADGLVREIREELSVNVTIHGLRTVNWLPAWGGWDDACVFVFDLGVADTRAQEQMKLQSTEIRGVHWCHDDIVRDRATAVTIELLDALRNDAPAYREHGR